MLAQSCAFSQNLDRLFTGDLILVIINILLIVARIIYKTNNPLDAETEKIMTEKRAQELQNGKSKKKKILLCMALSDFKSNTIIYAYSPDNQSEIQDILTEIGYLSQTK